MYKALKSECPRCFTLQNLTNTCENCKKTDILNLQALSQEEQRLSEYKRVYWTHRNDISAFFAVIVALGLVGLSLTFGGQMHEDIIPFGILLVIILVMVWIVEIKNTKQKNVDCRKAVENIARAMHGVIEDWRGQQDEIDGVSFLQMSETDFCKTALSHYIADGLNIVDVARNRPPTFLGSLPKDVLRSKLGGFQKNGALEKVTFKEAVSSVAPLAENISDSKLKLAVYVSLVAEDDGIMKMQKSLTIALKDGYAKWRESNGGAYVQHLLKFAK